MFIFHSLKASGSTFSHLYQRLLKSFKEAALSLRQLGKPILQEHLYLGPLEIILRTVTLTFRLHLLICPAGNINNLIFDNIISQEYWNLYLYK